MEQPIQLKKKNIYPFSRENFDAIIKYYFISNGITLVSEFGLNDINKLYAEAMKVELFEFEFIVNCIFQHFYIFESNLIKGGLTISNLCTYGLDAYKGHTNVGSKERSRITKLIYDQMVNSVLK